MGHEPRVDHSNLGFSMGVALSVALTVREGLSRCVGWLAPVNTNPPQL